MFYTIKNTTDVAIWYLVKKSVCGESWSNSNDNLNHYTCFKTEAGAKRALKAWHKYNIIDGKYEMIRGEYSEWRDTIIFYPMYEMEV